MKSCGENVKILSDYVDTYPYCGGYYFSMSPNPADGYVEISIEESKMAENNINEYEVRVYNGMNIMVYQTKSGESTLRINTRQFINGTYSVHFIAGDKVQVEKLIVSH